MSTRQIVLAAMTAALSAGMTSLTQAAEGSAGRRCSEIAKPGQNACAEPSTLDPAPAEWHYTRVNAGENAGGTDADGAQASASISVDDPVSDAGDTR